jgi:hypothetical protein
MPVATKRSSADRHRLPLNAGTHFASHCFPADRPCRRWRAGFVEVMMRRLLQIRSRAQGDTNVANTAAEMQGFLAVQQRRPPHPAPSAGVAEGNHVKIPAAAAASCSDLFFFSEVIMLRNPRQAQICPLFLSVLIELFRRVSSSKSTSCVKVRPSPGEFHFPPTVRAQHPHARAATMMGFRLRGLREVLCARSDFIMITGRCEYACTAVPLPGVSAFRPKALFP